MRRLIPLMLVVLIACGSVRSHARDDLVGQLVDEGGLERSIAECVVDKFFEQRTTLELKQFFQREGLTPAERVGFARLGQECVANR